MRDVVVNTPFIRRETVDIFLSLMHQLSRVITHMRFRFGAEHHKRHDRND